MVLSQWLQSVYNNSNHFYQQYYRYCYGFVLILCFGTFYSIHTTMNKELEDILKASNTQRKFTPMRVKKVKLLPVIQDLEHGIKKYELQTIMMKFLKKEITLELKGSYSTIVEFLLALEVLTKYFNVKNIFLIYNPISDSLNLHLKLHLLSKVRETNFLLLTSASLPNVFHIQTKIEKNKINAIIGNYVLFENQWLTVGSFYKEMKVMAIHKNYIEVEKNKKQIRLELPYYEYSQ